VTEHLSTSARMDAFTKGKHSYLCGTLGPIVLLHYIKDFWTAKKLHTFLTRIPSGESIWGSCSKKDRLLKNQ
jgi:hypothetical protein